MDKLQWFKFTPSDWMMGKIQRCPEITQARFLRLCCMYWNKDCELSIEDSIIEIDKEHFDILISKKILTTDNSNIYISFLDEQNLEIKEVSKDKSTSGIVGNLKRWHNVIYQRFKSKEISLEEAIELSKIIAKPSHTDSTPIAPPSQNIADKIKTIQDEEEIREDEEKKRKEIKKSLLSEIKISDLEINEVQYFEIAIAYQKLFIKNLKEKNAPAANQEKATYKNYVTPIRLMMSIDGVTKEQLTLVYKYLGSVEGEFWKSNILSTSKLREKFQQLLLKSQENGKSGNYKSGNTTPTTDELAEQSYSAVAKLLGRTQ